MHIADLCFLPAGIPFGDLFLSRRSVFDKLFFKSVQINEGVWLWQGVVIIPNSNRVSNKRLDSETNTKSHEKQHKQIARSDASREGFESQT